MQVPEEKPTLRDVGEDDATLSTPGKKSLEEMTKLELLQLIKESKIGGVNRKRQKLALLQVESKADPIPEHSGRNSRQGLTALKLTYMAL